MPALTVTFTHIGLKFSAEVDFTPETPAQLYGPPENCYPAEGGEADITTLTVDGYEAMFLLNSELAEELYRIAYDACCDQMQSMAEDAAESRAQARADDRMYG